MTHSNPVVVAVMEDLMFMVRIQDAAKRAGLKTIVVKTRTEALRQALEQPLLMIIDLNYAASEPLELIKMLRADRETSPIPILAFVSHVQTDMRAAAISAGCDTVLARSAFVQNLPDIMSRCVAGVSI